MSIPSTARSRARPTITAETDAAVEVGWLVDRVGEAELHG